MYKFAILVAALEIVEERLKEPMKVSDLAEACYSSCSGLQKLFSFIFHCSVNEYITKRRLTCASREILTKKKSVTQLALEYQYGSPEAFSRAFKRFWGISPNEFRRTRRFSGLFPKFKLSQEEGEIIMLKRKPVDISELYDELKSKRGNYVLIVDLINFSDVNKNFGHATGDIVIAEAFARLENVIDENMLLFRIGGDEFAIVTDYKDANDAECLAKKITAQNGEMVNCMKQTIPLSVRIGIGRLPDESINYQKALNLLYDALEEAREVERLQNAGK